jgi:hypothetical protein
MTQPMTCPKCNGSMEPGFMLDRKDNWDSGLQASWVDGEPTPKTSFGRMNLEGRERMPVTTYRCQGCGYLESFANPTA